MRTPVLLAAAASLLMGCYSPTAMEPDRAMGVWRDLQAEASTVAAAATQPGEPMELTADAAVSHALRVHPDIQASQARLAHARTQEGAITLIPGLELRLTEFQLDQIEKQETAFDLGVRVRPIRPGVRSSERHRAAQGVTMDALRVSVAAQVRRLHARAKLADVREAALGQERLFRGEDELRIKTRMAHDAATELDLRLAQLATLESRDDEHEARLEAMEARARLRSLLQLSPDQAIALNRPAGGIASPTAAPPSREAAVQEALTNRPETREVAARLAQAQSDLWREEIGRWPWLSFAQVSREVGPKAGSLDYGFALGLEVPFERWFGDRVSARHAQVEVMRQAERASVAAVVQEVDTALARLEKARARYQDIEERLLPAIEAAQVAATRARKLDDHEPTRRLKLELTRLSATRRSLEAMADLIEAQIHLRSVLARP
jgi:outer membrane protein TolC